MNFKISADRFKWEAEALPDHLSAHHTTSTRLFLVTKMMLIQISTCFLESNKGSFRAGQSQKIALNVVKQLRTSSHIII